jgi:hypothetical protein
VVVVVGFAAVEEEELVLADKGECALGSVLGVATTWSAKLNCDQGVMGLATTCSPVK